MRKKIFLAAAVALFLTASDLVRADGSPGVALSGQVTSTEEGPMEGVLVSAKKADSTVTITVVSDDKGRYNFPSAKLTPGQYSLAVRAVGYELDGAGAVEITPEKTATADLKLHKTKRLASQLTNAEWIASVPGSQQQKTTLLSCVGCHTLERIARSQHNATEFVQVLQRMANYANQSTPLRPQLRLGARDTALLGEEQSRVQRSQAEWLSTINLSSSSTWDFPLKTSARPKGKATRVIITEYDLPRATIEPHDVVVDAEGIVWYSNFGEQAIGRLDPVTARVTEYPVPILKEGFPTGNLGLQFDQQGNLWLGLMNQGGIAKFDTKTRRFESWSLPREWNNDATQVNMVHPEQGSVDGKIWLENHGYTMILRMDLKAGTFEPFQPFKGTYEKGETHNIYDVVPDSKNNAYFTDFEHGQIGRIDAKSGSITFYQTPTPNSRPRRAWMDPD